jgi:hypothetical protein
LIHVRLQFPDAVLIKNLHCLCGQVRATLEYRQNLDPVPSRPVCVGVPLMGLPREREYTVEPEWRRPLSPDLGSKF